MPKNPSITFSHTIGDKESMLIVDVAPKDRKKVACYTYKGKRSKRGVFVVDEES